jgi:hypothetical protein
MSPTEQELACLHTDLLLLQYRMELTDGVRQVQVKAAEQQQRLRLAAAKRDAQSDIFGTRTMKEKRIDEIKLQRAGEVPSIPTVCGEPLVLTSVIGPPHNQAGRHCA